ncbi:hypothetical protein ACWD7C_14230 [Streptomyces sp. NPDC005134]
MADSFGAGGSDTLGRAGRDHRAFRNGYRTGYDVASDDAFRQFRMAHP